MKYRWKRQTAIFLTSQGISLFGSALVQFAITAYITVQTKSGVYATLAVLCAILPTFLLSPFAGVWADKYNRKLLTILADAGIALCTLIMVIFFSTGKGSINILLVALAVRALGAAVQMPAVSALLPEMVPEDQLTRVNGINGTLQSLFTLVSPMLGAFLLGFAPLEAIFLIDVVTAGIAIVILIVGFRLPEKEKAEPKEADGNYFREMYEGIRYIWHNKFLVEFFIFFTIFLIAMAPAAFLTQIQVARNYGEGYWYISVMEVAFSGGMLIGGIAISIWKGFRNKVNMMIVSAIGQGICTFLLGIKVPFVVYCLIMVTYGIIVPFLNTPGMTLVQEKVDPQYMGRVFGIMTMINTSMLPLGMVIFGPLADKVSIEVLLLGTGVVIVLLAIAMSKSKALAKVGAETKMDTAAEARVEA